MEILIITYSVTRKAGGVFDAVRDLFTCELLKKHALKIFSFKDEFVIEDKVSWKGIPMKLFIGAPLLYSYKLKKAVLKENADILHMEALWRYPQILMSVWKKNKKAPIVCSPHGMLDPYIIKNQGKVKRLASKLFFRKSLDAVDCYHALCQKELEDIRAYGLMQPVAIIPNGINLPEVNLRYERADSKRHLLYLGRLHKKKGVDLLLKAFTLIAKENPDVVKNWQIDLVGWDHENCKEELESIVKTANISQYVVFHGGLFGEDKQRMYATSDGYILPSHGEGLPMTILEAWSWKLPVVMTPECHLPEGYDADAAIMISDNVDSVKEGLLKFFQMSDKEREEMGSRGYNLVCKQFTWDSAARKMMQVYDWLLNKAERPDFVFV